MKSRSEQESNMGVKNKKPKHPPAGDLSRSYIYGEISVQFILSIPRWKKILRQQIFSKNVFMLKWCCFKEAVLLKVRDTPLFKRWNSWKLHFASFKFKLLAFLKQYLAFKTQILKICNEDISFKWFIYVTE